MGPNLVFRGGVGEADPPLHHRQILVSNDQILVSDRQTDGQTDRQTDGQTDAINIFWAFLVKNEVRNVLGLPCFKKLSSEFTYNQTILKKYTVQEIRTYGEYPCHPQV